MSQSEAKCRTGERRSLVLGQHVFFGFVLLVLATVVVTGSALLALHIASSAADNLVSIHAKHLLNATQLDADAARMSAAARGYMLTGGQLSLQRMKHAGVAFTAHLGELRGRLATSEGADLLRDLEMAEAIYASAIERVTALRATGIDLQTGRRLVQEETEPPRDELLATIDAFRSFEEQKFELAEQQAIVRRSRALSIVVVVGATALLLSGVLTLLLLRALRAFSRKQREADDYLEQLERVNRDLDAFAGRIAHDLRNALTPLVLCGQLIRRTVAKPQSLERIAEHVERATRKTLHLLDGLLAFSRAGHRGDSTETASVAAVLDGVLEEVQGLASEVDAIIDRDIADATVSFSDGLLHIVAANLLTNALKFLKGRGERRVRVVSRSRGDSCEVMIEDTGPGIPADAIERVFEPFFRVPGVSVAGTGIGLATVRRILDAYGGRVAVESRVGQGARFTLSVPLARDATVGSAGSPTRSGR